MHSPPPLKYVHPGHSTSRATQYRERHEAGIQSMNTRHNYGLQVNLDNEALSVPDLRHRHNHNVLYESNHELDVDDVRELPAYSFRFGLSGTRGQNDDLPPLPIHCRGADSVGGNGSSTQSTLDHTQWESERSLFSRFRRGPVGQVPRRASFDSIMPPGSAELTSTTTYQRHYKSINVRPNKKNLLAYQQRRTATTPDYDTIHSATHSTLNTRYDLNFMSRHTVHLNVFFVYSIRKKQLRHVPFLACSTLNMSHQRSNLITLNSVTENVWAILKCVIRTWPCVYYQSCRVKIAIPLPVTTCEWILQFVTARSNRLGFRSITHNACYGAHHDP